MSKTEKVGFFNYPELEIETCDRFLHGHILSYLFSNAVIHSTSNVEEITKQM